MLSVFKHYLQINRCGDKKIVEKNMINGQLS